MIDAKSFMGIWHSQFSISYLVQINLLKRELIILSGSRSTKRVTDTYGRKDDDLILFLEGNGDFVAL